MTAQVTGETRTEFTREEGRQTGNLTGMITKKVTSRVHGLLISDVHNLMITKSTEFATRATYFSLTQTHTVI